ncbi:rubredoxin-like domain-containing protein [Methylomarinum sp. Ch1-1]|uniref:Rubredoxin-like domain-containing protein n=1 Tax=Methylomarinum roseum TaxID=3067653 RepID=A0AAU7P091_9GAMM|nr:MBL fold metallo-hydrolase [Methylomarinum sp. Ch1-1]MDP4521689.1 MBL fold metallo-hydrolase [Methylomarinum sp. Ch1-1]
MKQWVCETCGYNMIGEQPEHCPFCGADRDHFISWEQAEKTYRVCAYPVNADVTQLISEPRLGLEHAAYRVETKQGTVWIDCPSAFNRTLEPVQAILFTHPHFMGASNQYRELWQATVYLHALDAENPLAKPFPVDKRFSDDFVFAGIEAYHIGGHTPGFTLYIYQDVLFICDYAFPPGSSMRLNPFGPERETRQGAQIILKLIKSRPLKTVCGYNYCCDFKPWLDDFRRLVD